MNEHQRCLLAVFAHPDDEVFSTGGILRKYSNEGVRTALVCATRGEAGEISDPALATRETLGQVRERELRESCRILGVSDLIVLDYHDGMLAAAGEIDVIDCIVRQIRCLRPQVVVTFDAKGVYGHTDHLAVHRLATAAFHQAGDPSRYPAQISEGLQPYAPRKLYYTANALSVFRQMRELVLAEGLAFTPGGNAATLTLEQMGTPDDEITTSISLSDTEFAAKMSAMQAHRSQMRPDAYFNRMSDETKRLWRGTERFVLAYPPGAPGDASEHDLFAGVPNEWLVVSG